MLAAALVLCAGGATAAVVSGAVAAPPWLKWSPAPKPLEPASQGVAAKAAHQAKRVTAKSASVSAAAPSEAGAVAAPESESVLPSPAPSVVPPLAVVSTPVPVAAPVQPTPSVVGLRASSRAAFSSTATTVVDSEPRVEAPVVRTDPAAALFADANRARRDGNAERAVALYRSLQSRYPSSSESELSRALLAQLLLDRGSPEAALAGFDRYLAADAPVLGAEALVGRARALEQLGKSAQAIAAWKDVQSRFAGSVHARLAAARLAALGMR
jgi:TolA-binding protein